MALLGKRNSLKVLYSTPQGIYLDGGDGHGEILLPTRYIPKGTALDQMLDVFVYRDSEDRLIATTEKPLAQVGEFGTFEVMSVNANVGAFLNWGLAKDLLLPFREQAEKVRAGDKVVAYVMLDERSDRIVATTRINRFLSKQRPRFKQGQQVALIITHRTPLGYNAIVEGTHMGLLYHSNIGAQLQSGQQLRGYVTGVSFEGKIDLSLDASGYKRVVSLTDQILQALKDAGGKLEFDDDSAPEAIRAAFNTSKKAFKQALGALYRQRQIEFTRPGIRWLDIREARGGDWQPSESK